MTVPRGAAGLELEATAWILNLLDRYHLAESRPGLFDAPRMFKLGVAAAF